MSRRELRGVRKKVAEGPGSQEEPYNISDEDETEVVDTPEQPRAEEKIDRILRDAGIDPVGMMPEEKAPIVKILHESSKALKHEETMHTVKVTRGRARQQQPAAENQLPKVNKPPVSKSVSKANAKKKPKQEEEDSDPESESQQSEVLSSSAVSTPCKNTQQQTASSVSDIDKGDFEVTTKIKVTPRGNRLGMKLGKRTKLKDNSPDDKQKCKGKRQTKLQKQTEDAIDVSSDSEADDIPEASHSPEYGSNQDSGVKRAVKRPVTSETKNDRPKRQRKSPSDEQKKTVYRKIDLENYSEEDEAAANKGAPKAKRKKAGKAAKPFYTQITYDTSDEAEGDNLQHVAKSPGKMELEVKVKLKISPQDAKMKAAEGSSTADESVSGEAEGEGQSQEEIVYRSNGSQGQTRLKVTEQTEPFSGVSVSPDLFGSQQLVDDENQDKEVTDDDVLNLEPTDDETQSIDVGAGTADDYTTADEAPVDAAPVDDDETQEMMEGPDGPVPVPTPAPEPVHTLPVPKASVARAHEELIDVWIEAAKKRAARDKAAVLGNKSTKTKDTAKESEEAAEDTPCPYCARLPPTDFSEYKPMVNKTKLRQKLDDPEPYFAPPSVCPDDHVKTILGYFSSYHARLREAQSKKREKVKWEWPVNVGKHCASTLFVKVRGKPERHCDFNFADVDSDDLPDLNVETIQANVMEAVSGHGLGRNTRKRAVDRDWLPDEQNDNNDDDDFEPSSKTSRSTRKNAGETGRLNRRGTRRKQMETNTVSDYFTNNKPLKRRGAVGKAATRSVVTMETQQSEVLDIEEGSNDGPVPLGQPGHTAQNAQPEVVSLTSDTPTSRPSSTETNQSATKNVNGQTATQHDSRSNSPLPFKLTGISTMAYDDNDVTDDEVETICNIDKVELNEKTGDLVSKQAPTSRTGKEEDVSEVENTKDDDIHLFEDPEPAIEPVQSPAKRKRQHRVTKANKNPVTMEGGVTRRGTRTKRVKSPVSDEDIIPGTQREDVKPERHMDGNDVPGAALQNASEGTQRWAIGSAEARRPLRERVSDRVPVLVAPLGTTTQTHTNPRQIIRPHIVEKEQPEEEKVECPLCCRPYGQSQIETHAATCEGNPSPEGAGGDPGHPPEPVQPRQGRLTRQAGPTFTQGAPRQDADSDDEGGFVSLNNNLRIGREGAPNTRGTDSLKNYRIPRIPGATAPPKKQVTMGNCPICNKLQPLESLETHADACARRLEAGEAVQQEQPRRTRTNPLPVYQPQRQPGGNVQQPRARGAAVYELSDSGDEFAANMTGTRRMRTQQPHIQDFMNSKNSGVHKARVLPMSATFTPTLSCPGTSPPSTRTPNLRPPPMTNLHPAPTTPIQRPAPQPPAVVSGSDSGSGSEEEGSETSSSDADDHVTLRTALNVPQEVRQQRAALTARRQGPARATNSPIRTFQPISAIQGENLIDFRNQFRTARPGTSAGSRGRGRGGGARGKRKRTGGKRKSRKKRKVNTNGANSKGAKTAPPKTLKDVW